MPETSENTVMKRTEYLFLSGVLAQVYTGWVSEWARDAAVAPENLRMCGFPSFRRPATVTQSEHTAGQFTRI